MRPPLPVFIVPLLVATLACGRGGGEVEGEVPPVEQPVEVLVTNLYSLPMEVLASGANSRQRLGVVNPGMSGQFVIPAALVGQGSIELIAHATADARSVARSGPLLLSPGAVVDFRIGAQLFNSTATVGP